MVQHKTKIQLDQSIIDDMDAVSLPVGARRLYYCFVEHMHRNGWKEFTVTIDELLAWSCYTSARTLRPILFLLEKKKFIRRPQKYVFNIVRPKELHIKKIDKKGALEKTLGMPKTLSDLWVYS